MSRIVLDVNLTYRLNFNEGFEGISRVEKELFEYLSNHHAEQVAFCINKPTRHGFISIEQQILRNTKSKKHYQKKHSLLKKWKNSLLKRLRCQFLTFGNGKVRGKYSEWLKDDCYVNVSNLWGLLNEDEFRELRQRDSLKIILFCHDLTPILFPHWYNYSTRSKFSIGLQQLALADLVLCNSTSTMHDFQKLCRQYGINYPKTIVTQLNGDLITDKKIALTHNLLLTNQKFVLTVGTISDRKNYDLLCNLWESFFYDTEMRDLILVIVGGAGWHGESVLRRLASDPILKGRVIHLKEVADSELLWLYQHCLFTLYPSFYEGWGLPITESLASGKACIASSSSSMPEASQGLGIHINPLDFMKWRSEIRKLTLDENYRNIIENRIHSDFTPGGWHQVTTQIITVLNNHILSISIP